MTDYTALSALLKTVLLECQPHSILCLDDAAASLLSHIESSQWERSTLDSGQWRLEPTFTTRCDIALYLGGPQDFSSQEKIRLLSSARDLLAAHVLAFVPADSLSIDTLRSLGYTLLARPHEDLFAWSFDIMTYKSVPDWLNPRFWANPENWNRFRW